MATGKINLQKASGGITAITGVDGTGNTSIIVPESGTLATTAQATESLGGLIELATTAEAQAGTDDSRAITTLKLFNSLKGSNQTLSSNGYQKLHGGLIIQWGSATIGASGAVVTLPIAFPTNMVAVIGGISDAGLPSGTLYAYRNGSSLSQIILDLDTASTANATYIAIGY